jgi:hypothetical protein
LVLGAEHEKNPGQQTDCGRAQCRRKKAQQLAPARDRRDLDDRDDQRDDEEDRTTEERGNTVQRDEGASPLDLMPPAFSSRDIELILGAEVRGGKVRRQGSG